MALIDQITDSQESNSRGIISLNQILVALERYLYNFYLRKIKPLATKQGLPMEFFKQKYDKELDNGIRVYLEQVYFLRIDELARFYKTNRSKLRISKSAAIIDFNLDFFVSALDLDNIKKAVTDLKNRFFNSINRLINRQNTEELNNETQQLEPLTPYDAAAVMKRLAIWGTYFTYNESLISKLTETLGLSSGSSVNGSNATVLQNAKVMYLSKEDPRVCPQCAQYNRKIFRVTDRFLPMPPLHYNCRCVLVPR